MVNRILLAAVVFLVGIIAGRSTSALLPASLLADKPQVVTSPWLVTVACKSDDDLRCERLTSGRPRFGFISLADDLCP